MLNLVEIRGQLTCAKAYLCELGSQVAMLGGWSIWEPQRCEKADGPGRKAWDIGQETDHSREAHQRYTEVLICHSFVS